MITEASTSSTPIFTLLELPVPIIYDILSRLPLADIFRSRCVCKMLLKLLKDPYFSKIHLSRAPTLRTNLILQEHFGKWGAVHFFVFDLSESTLSSCSSIDDDQTIYCSSLSKRNSEFSFRTNGLTLVGSCNGLLCFYSNPPSRPFYVICNPILGECIRLPQLTAPSMLYNYDNRSGFFGYCPRTKQYKIISFVDRSFADYLNSVYSRKIIVHIHTLGSDSWRKVENAPCPKRSPFDPFLNGALHWITDSEKPSELINSFELETEKFEFVAPPVHFNILYMNKVSWINVGVLRGCLCICYIYEDVLFDVWVMREYGVRESWAKEFGIDMKFYCKLRVEDLHRPVRFFGNGDMWFISSAGSLVSFSPQKRTFKELRSIGIRRSEVTIHNLSFISLKDVVGEKNPDLQKLRIGSRDLMFDL
ncbi:F-box/kelch-repeat protein at3g06240 [Phtheirospermum japonicum]|uniref:F-box/kelch-repeat protein at3g06240 n=1 Tax=Phtheirospermum japonicum TaxID=374723 RepID=A0A830CGM3_9LAMI|nr:F-box/kelch-repeat protein at3g06240 [Phtheirospermum japonicum]